MQISLALILWMDFSLNILDLTDFAEEFIEFFFWVGINDCLINIDLSGGLTWNTNKNIKQEEMIQLQTIKQ